MLGYAYSIGLGVQKDEVEALAWLNVAAFYSEKSAMQNRELLESRLGAPARSSALLRGRELINQIDKAIPAAPVCGETRGAQARASNDFHMIKKKARSGERALKV